MFFLPPMLFLNGFLVCAVHKLSEDAGGEWDQQVHGVPVSISLSSAPSRIEERNGQGLCCGALPCLGMQMVVSAAVSQHDPASEMLKHKWEKV